MTDETGICAKKPEHPLGNSFPFLMFLAANAIWIVACSVVLPLASILITPENGDLAKMRLAALARILALPLFLPMATLARTLGPALESRTTEWQSLKLAGLVLPIVTIGSYALMAIFQLMASNSGVEHPLTQLFRSGRTMDVWIVIALVVVIAPVTEEVLFRGFFQAWIISARLGPLVGWCMALALVACFIPNQIYSPQADTHGMSKLFVYAQIAAYLLIGAALILLAGRFSHLAASAVYAGPCGFQWTRYVAHDCYSLNPDFVFDSTDNPFRSCIDFTFGGAMPQAQPECAGMPFHRYF